MNKIMITTQHTTPYILLPINNTDICRIVVYERWLRISLDLKITMVCGYKHKVRVRL